MSRYTTKLTESNIDETIDRLVFDEPVIDEKYGNVSVRISITDEKGDKRPLSLESPWMKAFVGISKYEGNGPNARAKYAEPVSFHKMETYERQRDIKTFFEKIDERLLDEGFANAGAWLKRAGEPKAVVKAFYTPALTFSKDKQGQVDDRYPPNLKFKLGTYQNDDGSVRFGAPVYLDRDSQVDDVEESVQKGSEVKAIIDCTGVWCVNGKFGAGWRVGQMKLKERKNQNSYAFCDESDGEDDTPTEESPSQAFEEDEEGVVEDEEPVVAKEATPPPSPKKRRGGGKRAAAKTKSKAT